MIESGSITVERSMRYSLRKATGRTRVLVYILHGYGQLATYFIRKVQDILPEDVTIVVPEGLHRFYLSGTSGRVGASWMTKEARELDIAENSLNLEQLHQHLLETFQPEKVLVAGFSQGGATAARWVAKSACSFDGFASWASVFPPDVAFPEHIGGSDTKRFFILGSEDPFFDETTATEAKKTYTDAGFEIWNFEGGHDLDPAIMTQLISQL